MTPTPAIRIALSYDRLHAQYVRRDGDAPRLVAPTDPFAVPLDFIKGCETCVSLGGNVIAERPFAVAAARLVIRALNRFHGAATDSDENLFVRTGSPFQWLHGNEDWATRNGLLWTDMSGWTRNVDGGFTHRALRFGGIGHLVTTSGRLLFTWDTATSASEQVVGGYFVVFADAPILAELGIADDLATLVREAAAAHQQLVARERLHA